MSNFVTGGTTAREVRGKADRLLDQDMKMSFKSIPPLDDVETLWLDLEQHSDGSVFQSWAWIGCWLRHLPSVVAPRLMSVSIGPEVVGLGVFVPRRERRHGLLHVHGLHLNETGDIRMDPINIEYNGLLVDSRVGNAPIVRHSLIHLAERENEWDELYLSGLDAKTTESWMESAREIGLGIRLRAKKRCDYVDLDGVRRRGGDYLGLLSRNTRHQIRRAMRIYEAHGPIAVAAARSATDGLDILDELKKLHQGYWIRRGHPGAFGCGFFEVFHRELIEKRFDAGEIQLLRISAGNKRIGCLYNLIKDGWVSAYQSGFCYESDSRLKPGLVSHFLAIKHNLAEGARIYDFMAGDSRHKRSLGTDSHDLRWLVVQRPHVGLKIENTLRAVRRKFIDQMHLG